MNLITQPKKISKLLLIGLSQETNSNQIKYVQFNFIIEGLFPGGISIKLDDRNSNELLIPEKSKSLK